MTDDFAATVDNIIEQLHQAHARLMEIASTTKAAANDVSLHPVPWTIEYDNDTGPDDESFWEWWEVIDANGDTVAKCNRQASAELLVAMAAELTGTETTGPEKQTGGKL